MSARKFEGVRHHLGVVHGLAEDPGAEGGHIEDGSQGHAAPVLKACDALEGHLLAYDIDVWKARSSCISLQQVVSPDDSGALKGPCTRHLHEKLASSVIQA